MRQLHYGRHALSGSSGAAQATRGWCTALAAAGAEVELVVDERTRRLPCPDGISCSSVRHVGTRKLAVPRGFHRRLSGSDVLVVHAGLRPHTAFAARRADRAGKPYIVSSHGIYIEGALARNRRAKKVAEMWFERGYLKRSTAVHVYFEEEARDIRSLGIAPRLIVARPGVSVPPDVRWDGGSGGYLMWLGRFDPVQKGLDLLLEALSLLPTTERPLLYLFGTEWRGQKTKVLEEIEKHDVGSWVTVGEPVYGAAKWDLLSAAAGFVYPSRYEAFGMSVAEAVSIGLPTLATPFGLSRFLAERDAVFLAELAPGAIAAGIKKLLSEGAREVGATASRVARAELSWEASAESWLEQASAIMTERRR